MSNKKTKYSVPDGYWDRDQPDETDLPDHHPTHVQSHAIDVIHVEDPHKKNGYGRTMFTTHLSHRDDGGGPIALYCIRHRWKGNFWREAEELDWYDIPGVVRQRVAAALSTTTADLDPECRLIGEGGRTLGERR
jgi:hypothetical protein